MMNSKEIQMMNDAIDVKKAALKRAANTESDPEIKAIRIKHEAELNNLQMKINTKGLFDETTIGKQK